MHEDIEAYNDTQTPGNADICRTLARAIDQQLPGATSKIWHRHPVWFLDGNPIVGYSKLKDGVRLFFWSGASFGEERLKPGTGKFKDASILYTAASQIDAGELERWLQKSRTIQWDYKNVVKRKGKLERLRAILLFLALPCLVFTAVSPLRAQQSTNKPERVQWFQDLAFGMFIHWNVDVSLGAVISHTLAGASDDYVNRYIGELPGFFNPTEFNPQTWAKLARLAGMKYVVFTAKHHSGFCMFDTRTTAFNVMNTPFGRDVTGELIDAFRKEGIAIGLYFSPEDFTFLHQQGLPIGRLQHPMHFPQHNTELMAHDKAQIKELLTQYGNIDIMFFDGPGDGLREYAWSINPDLIITRDLMKTPEQHIPDQPLPRPWETCYTMGTDWQYKPTNDPHKSGTEIINMFIEIRAKGGNFLLNVGPDPSGNIPVEQENLLREIALWNFVNRDAVYAVKPLPRVRHKNIWFTQSNDDKYIYAFITRESPADWAYGERQEFLLPMITGGAETTVEVLGYKSELVEYREGFDASLRVSPSELGLAISAVNGQRFYTNNQWPNAVVLKIGGARFNHVKENQGKTINMHGAQ